MLVGAAVRMAECMGLNRDGSKAYNLSPLETHVRRLIWHQLCFLDIRTCEAQGPKPAIRREDYDTWLPDNCEEDQITASGTCQARPSDGWTSALFPVIRFEINEMMRTIWADRRRLEARKMTPAQVLAKVEDFRRRMLEKYDQLLEERVPIQRYAKIVMHLLLYRLHVMVLHPYYANTASPMPQRLRCVLITSATMIIERAAQLESDPAFRTWHWYAGAYQQFQAALILATEMYYHPEQQRYPGRIWRCLDYVFGTSSSMPPEEKGRRILGEIMDKMGAYVSMRRMRAPIITATASLATHAVQTENVRGSLGGVPRQVTTPEQPNPSGPSISNASNAEPLMSEGVAAVPSDGTQLNPFRAGPPRLVRDPERPVMALTKEQPWMDGAACILPSIYSGPQDNVQLPGFQAAGVQSGDTLWRKSHVPHLAPLDNDSPGLSSSDCGSASGSGRGSSGSTAGPVDSMASLGGSSMGPMTGAPVAGVDWVSFSSSKTSTHFLLRRGYYPVFLRLWRLTWSRTTRKRPSTPCFRTIHIRGSSLASATQ